MATNSKMIAENVILKFIDSYNKNDMDGAMACLADDFMWLGKSTNGAPMSKERFRHMWSRFAVAFPDSKWETVCMVVAGDTVAIDVIETGTFTKPWNWQGKTLWPTGKRYRSRICIFFRVNKYGLIQEREEEGTSIARRARCVEQAGNRRSWLRHNHAT